MRTCSACYWPELTCVRLAFRMKEELGERVAGLPEVLENGIVRSPLKSTIVDYFGTLGRHD